MQFIKWLKLTIQKKQGLRKYQDTIKQTQIPNKNGQYSLAQCMKIFGAHIYSLINT